MLAKDRERRREGEDQTKGRREGEVDASKKTYSIHDSLRAEQFRILVVDVPNKVPTAKKKPDDRKLREASTQTKKEELSRRKREEKETRAHLFVTTTSSLNASCSMLRTFQTLASIPNDPIPKPIHQNQSASTLLLSSLLSTHSPNSLVAVFLPLGQTNPSFDPEPITSNRILPSLSFDLFSIFLSSSSSSNSGGETGSCGAEEEEPCFGRRLRE